MLAGAAMLWASAGPALAGATDNLELAFDQMLGTAPRSAPAEVRMPAVPAPQLTRWSQAVVQPTYSTSFEAQLAALADASQGRIGVAALDLRSGKQIAVLGDQPFPMASTSKIAIVATFLAGVDAGRWRLTDSYPLMLPLPSKKFAGEIAPVRAGTMMSALELIERAITRSDNHATDALLAAVGGPAVVTRWVQQTAGINEFRLDRDIATLVRDDGAVNPAFTIDRRDSVTPNAMLRLLAGVHEGRWLSRASNGVLLGAMARCVTGRNRIRAGMPEGVQVAHKTGTLSNTASDVGFITTPDGRNLAVAIYVTGQGGKVSRDARIATLARAIYDGYAGPGADAYAARTQLRR